MQPLILQARAKSSVINTVGAVNLVNDILLEALKLDTQSLDALKSDAYLV